MKTDRIGCTITRSGNVIRTTYDRPIVCNPGQSYAISHLFPPLDLKDGESIRDIAIVEIDDEPIKYRQPTVHDCFGHYSGDQVVCCRCIATDSCISAQVDEEDRQKRQLQQLRGDPY